MGAMGGMASAAGVLGLATAPIAAMIGAGVKQAADFEQQMSAVGAVSQASGEEMKALEIKAKQMGASTVFTATQAGQAMEYLARAGFSTSENIAALDGVLAAAAADGMDLASAADIMSNVLRSMHLEASEAVRVSDVLALVSAKTNTNIRGLGGSFKYAAAQATTMGIDFETTAASLGVIADSGLDATAGGTAFTNMLVQLSRPTKKAAKIMNELGTHVHENDDGTVNLVATLKDFNAEISKIPSRTKRAQYTTELFGIRGQKAFNALAAGLGRVNEDGVNKLEETINAAYNAQGSAATMAERRLGNFKGAIILAKSAIEGFAIETAGQFLGPMTRGVKVFTKSLSGIVNALIEINGGVTDTTDLVAKFGQRSVDIAMGISSGIELFKWQMEAVKNKIKEVAEFFGSKLGPTTDYNIAKIITMTTLYAGLLSPILLGVRSVMFVVSGLAPLFSGIFSAIGAMATGLGAAITLPVLAAIAIIIYAWFNARDQIQALLNGIIDIFIGVWGIIRDSAMAFWNAFIEQARPAFEYIADSFRTAFHEVISFLKKLVDYGIQVVDVLKPMFVGLFEAIGWIAGKVFQGIAIIFGGLVQLLKPVFDIFANLVKFLLEDIVNAMMSFVRLIVKAANALHIDLPKGLVEFAGDLNRPKTFRLLDNTQEKKTDHIGNTVNAAQALMAMDQANANKAAANKPPKLEASVNVENKQKLDIHNCMKVDGRELAVATARHQQEVNERAGFKATRWQQKFSLEQGATPIPGGGGM